MPRAVQVPPAHSVVGLASWLLQFTQRNCEIERCRHSISGGEPDGIPSGSFDAGISSGP
ncbi:protein of unknown function [Methylorubrum extorquens]|uniref:Uncharacterized protein n=1 Tax=Methylorubrum extorquens TaxID=408 RepID=A0A2N9AYV3_METEX|nr:protein of unknown function [Methylorubrum extorquens]